MQLLDGAVELVPTENLVEHPANPRRGNIDVIVESIRRNGFYGTVVRQASTGYVLVGNHRSRAARMVGLPEVPVQTIDVDDETALRILAVDNRSNDLAEYDDASLIELLQSIDDLVGTGYDDEFLATLVASYGDETDALGAEESDRAPTTGELLQLADVTWGEPEHEVHNHQVWKVGRHTLVIAHLQREHEMWRGYLTDGVIFAPYPEPYLTASSVAEESALLLVQPNRFLAGHLLDKHASIFPDEVIERLE